MQYPSWEDPCTPQVAGSVTELPPLHDLLDGVDGVLDTALVERPPTQPVGVAEELPGVPEVLGQRRRQSLLLAPRQTHAASFGQRRFAWTWKTSTTASWS